MFRATIHTQGPWDPQFQHGGPPAALLVRQLEACSPRENLVLARVSIDILAPVPIETLTARACVLHPGATFNERSAATDHQLRPLSSGTDSQTACTTRLKTVFSG